MKLHELLTEARIRINATADDREEAIGQLVDILAENGDIADRAVVTAMVIERELQVGTGIGYGIAIPHAEPGPFPRAMAAFLRLEKGVDFHAPDGREARLIFLLLTPDETPALHVRLLARICRLTRSGDLRRRLLNAASPQEALAVIEEAELDFPDLNQ